MAWYVFLRSTSIVGPLPSASPKARPVFCLSNRADPPGSVSQTSAVGLGVRRPEQCPTDQDEDEPRMSALSFPPPAGPPNAANTVVLPKTIRVRNMMRPLRGMRPDVAEQRHSADRPADHDPR